MARIKLSAPPNILFEATVPVRITDINYGNHVGNNSFVSIVHEARVLWLKKNGYTELDIEGIGLIMADLAIEFKNEGLYGDNIKIQISVGEVSKISFELYYSLFTERNEKRIVLAVAKTGMVCYDYTAKKVAGLPEKIRHILLGT